MATVAAKLTITSTATSTAGAEAAITATIQLTIGASIRRSCKSVSSGVLYNRHPRHHLLRRLHLLRCLLRRRHRHPPWRRRARMHSTDRLPIQKLEMNRRAPFVRRSLLLVAAILPHAASNAQQTSIAVASQNSRALATSRAVRATLRAPRQQAAGETAILNFTHSHHHHLQLRRCHLSLRLRREVRFLYAQVRARSIRPCYHPIRRTIGSSAVGRRYESCPVSRLATYSYRALW